MKMRFILFALIIILSVSFQSSVQPLVSQKFVFFDFPALITIATGIFVSPFAGCLTGFFTGLFQDLSTGAVVGLGMLTFTITGYAAGVIEQNIKADERFALAVLMAALTVLKYAVSGMLTGLAGMGFKLLPFLYMSILPAMINGLLFYILFSPVSLLSSLKSGRS